MRYLGNKTSLTDVIVDFFKQKGIYRENLVFFDAFCGTGSVSYALKDVYNVILNDNLKFATTFATGRIVKDNCAFKKLGYNPFVFFNENKNVVTGFFSENFAPKISGRMYFSDFNAGRIDFFRLTIEDWFSHNLITNDEYIYLLSSLLESVSKVANVAGVYGAFLKKWDPRATKEIVFQDVDGYIGEENIAFAKGNKRVKVYNANVEDIISDIECDILYLDPPYTKNSYSVQYHILETLVQNDTPILKGITGARSYENVSNLWSKSYEVDVLFEKTIALTKSKYIVLSYSSDGLMSKDYILKVLKRYCIIDSIDVLEIPYKKYNNFKTEDFSNGHYEYLFFAEKKNYRDVEFYCPLNYMGGKTNVIGEIKPYLCGKNKFIDLMGGGFNVGINAFGYDYILYNDINFKLVEILQLLKNVNVVEFLKFIDKVIKKHELKKNDKDSYLRFRSEYNEKLRFHPKSNWYLFVLILYGFQQQMRFNSKYEFNNPVGESGYGDCIKEKIVSFSRRLKELNVDFRIGDFSNILADVDCNCVIYVDPPYLITLGSYNDGKRGFNGWNYNEEKRLLCFLDECKKKNAKIVISNILDYKGEENILLKKWMENKNVSINNIIVRKRNEVLIVYN